MRGKNASDVYIDNSLKTDSLCWECARACGGANCPWADDLKPVKGWVITKLPRCDTKGVTVLYCPRFIKGRTKAELTEEQIEHPFTNSDAKRRWCRVRTIPIKNRHGHVVGKEFECPLCKTRYPDKIMSCTTPGCGINFLYDMSTQHCVSALSMQIIQQFLQEQQHDFPHINIED